MQEKEILQPGSSLDEPGNLVHLQISLSASGPMTSVRYDVVSDILYMDVHGQHPDGFASQETLKITARSLDPYSQRVWELTAPQRKFYKERYSSDMRDMRGIPPEIQQDVLDAERNEEVSESAAVNTQGPAVNTQGPAMRSQSFAPEQSLNQDFLILNTLVSDGRSAIEDLGQLFELYVEDEKIRAFGANVVKRIQRKYYEYGISEYNPDAVPDA